MENADTMRSGEVAKLFEVSVRTVNRWAAAGRLPARRRTPAGQWQFDRAKVMELLENE